MGSPVSNCGSSFLQKSQKDSDTASMNSVEARDLLQQHQIDLKSKDMFSPEKDVNLQTLAAHEKSSALIKWLDKRLYLQNASALSGLLKIRQATASLIAKMTSKH